DVGRIDQEDAADQSVASAKGLQHADHIRSLQDDDQQRGGHVDDGHQYHQDDHHPYVGVQQFQPGEDLRKTVAHTERPKPHIQVLVVHQVVHRDQVLVAFEGDLETARILGVAATAAVPVNINFI